MNACAWRARLLDADPSAFSGASDSEVGRHVASCAPCAADTKRILEAYEALDVHLDDHPPLDAAELVARARADANDPGPLRTGEGPTPPRAAPSRTRRVKRMPVWIPLAAAAAIAALLLRGPSEPEPLPGATPVALAPPDVSAPEGVNFAVLPTADPDITVVWIFQGEG